MKVGKLRLGLTNITDQKLVALGRAVVESMTDNPNFPEVGEHLTEAKTSYDAYVASIPARAVRNSVNSAAKNEKKRVCIQDMIFLGRYVESVALGNIELLESSGFELANKPTKRPILGTVEDITLRTNGVPGMVMAICKRNNFADLYEARVSVDESNWTAFGANTSRTVQVKDLPYGQQLFLQMRMKNSHGYGPWSGSVAFHIPEKNAVPALV